MEIDDAIDAHGNPLKLPIMMRFALEPDTIWVNKQGQRYIDEGYILQFFAYGYIGRPPAGGHLLHPSTTAPSCRLKEKEGIYNQMAPGWFRPTRTSPIFPLPGLGTGTAASA